MPINLREQERARDDLERFTKKVGIVVAAGIALLLLWAARTVLMLIFIAAVIAAGISPAGHRVRVLGRYWFKRNGDRGAAAVIVYIPSTPRGCGT